MEIAVIGAFGVVLAALVRVIVAARLTRDERSVAASELVVQNYLVQLQDAIESLEHRVANVRRHGGISSMASPEYYRLSSRYAIATFLGQKRRLTVDGVYGHLEVLWPGFGVELRDLLEDVERQLGWLADRRFQRYYRRDLADLSLDWYAESLRPVSYGQFQQRLTDPNHRDAVDAVDAAIEVLVSGDALLRALERVGGAVAAKTSIGADV